MPAGTEERLERFADAARRWASRTPRPARAAGRSARRPTRSPASRTTAPSTSACARRSTRARHGRAARARAVRPRPLQARSTTRTATRRATRCCASVARAAGRRVRAGELRRPAWAARSSRCIAARDRRARGALAAAERVRRGVARRAACGRRRRLTLSAGVCDLDHGRRAPRSSCRLADGALYWAKAPRPRHGRRATRPRSWTSCRPSERARAARALAGADRRPALARAVDAKDPSTREHSERVAELAVRAGAPARLERRSASRSSREAGADARRGQDRRARRRSCSSRARLTAEEYEQVKQHADARRADRRPRCSTAEQVALDPPPPRALRRRAATRRASAASDPRGRAASWRWPTPGTSMTGERSYSPAEPLPPRSASAAGSPAASSARRPCRALGSGRPSPATRRARRRLRGPRRSPPRAVAAAATSSSPRCTREWRAPVERSRSTRPSDHPDAEAQPGLARQLGHQVDAQRRRR